MHHTQTLPCASVLDAEGRNKAVSVAVARFLSKEFFKQQLETLKGSWMQSFQPTRGALLVKSPYYS